MTVLLPVRPSLGMPSALASVSTQRIVPSATRCASHSTVTALSRPEKPPSAATSAPERKTTLAAPFWLETAILAPPCAFA